MDIFHILLIILDAVNLAAFIAMGIDKYRAKKGLWRIPEAVLIALAVFGGSIGELAGMYLFHHKTRKKKFSVGVPVILGLQVLFALLMILTEALGR